MPSSARFRTQDAIRLVRHCGAFAEIMWEVMTRSSTPAVARQADTEQNFVTHGISTTPTLALVDSDWVVSFYRLGKVDYSMFARQGKSLLK